MLFARHCSNIVDICVCKSTDTGVSILYIEYCLSGRIPRNSHRSRCNKDYQMPTIQDKTDKDNDFKNLT